MNILDHARRLESRIARALKHAAEEAVGSEAPEPLEIAHAIVDAVERQVQWGSRGTRLFPFNRVVLSVVAPSRHVRAQFEALFAAAPSLHDRIVDRLRAAGCDAGDLQIELMYVGRPGKGWDHPYFHAAFERVSDVAPALPAGPLTAQLELTVVRGLAGRRAYSFILPRIDLGRGVEVRDSRHRLLRANHLAFIEGSAGANQTVSRRHAHIVRDPASGELRLYDDRSEHGTGIVRGGRTIPVPPGSRGVRLQSGDEIVLGEARVRIRIGDPRSSGGAAGSQPGAALVTAPIPRARRLPSSD